MDAVKVGVSGTQQFPRRGDVIAFNSAIGLWLFITH